MIKEFLLNYFWAVKMFIVVLFILSIVLMWKFGSYDYQKKLGVKLGKPYHRTKENDDIAKKLCSRSDGWGAVTILCAIIMIISYVAEAIKSFISWL